jgi:nucleoid-associated protein YgaU
MLTGLVDGLNLDIQNFDLEYSDGQVKVYGQVTSDADKEMVISALNTADGIRNVDNRISVVAPAHQTYVVKKGDSLSKIAKAYYGDPMKYKQIFAANTDLLDDPNKIFPGQELKIPKL